MVIIGHSLIDCIVDAAKERGVPVDPLYLWIVEPMVIRDEAGARLNDMILEKLGSGPVFCHVGGGEPHVIGLIEHPRPFDFVLPQAPDLPLIEGAEIVGVDMARAMMAGMSAEFFEVLSLMNKAAPGTINQIQVPPVLRDERPIEAELWRKRVGDSKKISPPGLRRKLWLLHCQMVAEFCEKEGIGFIPHPEGVTDEEGYLLPRYGGVPCHANRDYGSLVLDQLIAAGA